MVKFLFTLKQYIYNKIVMAFTANNVQTLNNNVQTTDNKEIPLSPSQLNAKEIEILLSLIKRSTFLGEDVEIIYNMVIKLQNQYLDQTK
jgi:hypothetical protein